MFLVCLELEGCVMLPSVTIILFAFNQESFVREAALSCLHQDYQGPLEIIFSDDCSVDKTFEILQQLASEYVGPHKVIARCNSENLGIGAHYNVAIAVASGELIFTAAGDDISHSQRVSIMVDAWISADKRPDLLTSDLRRMTYNGVPLDMISVADLSKWVSPEQWIRKRPYVVGAAHAFTRKLHSSFGDFSQDVVYEDQVMAFRATLAGGGIKIDKPLVMYREHGVSQSRGNIFSAEGYIKWAVSRFSRQYAQYHQIYNDLIRAGRPDLWRGKLRRKLSEAKLALDLRSCNTLWSKIIVAWHCRHAWVGFRLKHLVFFNWPALAAAVQKVQATIKSRKKSQAK